MITFQCSRCSKKYRISDEYAGKRVKCSCGTVNTVSPVTKEKSSGDTAYAYNKLLRELLKDAQQAPAIEAE